MNTPPTIVLYDGWCSACSKTADKFRDLDKNRNRIRCVDFRQDSERLEQHKLSPSEVRRVLHAITPNGEILTAMDALREIMRLLDRGWMIRWTRLPILRQISDRMYSLFARNRLRWFGKSACGECVGSTSPDAD